MKRLAKVVLASLVGVIVFVSKTEISSASAFLLYQPEPPEKEQ
ncbi:cyclic lactone autoinducer peptide [Halalkalibacter sp. APA_J-10(15)]|nr:cyclic lactone autoinducer peptide [Halalkalibacter sp. APA_J-10(15)]MCK0469897.1 cyclic lactone autoinducer peptide [Halalkalibacter sp. APA_J-10(15)]